MRASSTRSVAAMKKLTIIIMVASRCSEEVFLLVKHKHTQKHFLCLYSTEKLELVAKVLASPPAPLSTPTKSPLKETNQIGTRGHVMTARRSGDPLSKPGTPRTAGGCNFQTPDTTDKQRETCIRPTWLFSC